MDYRSAEINNLVKALASAQGAYKPLVPDTDSPRGKYASLRAILVAVREAISINGLAFWQHIEIQDEDATTSPFGSGAQLLISTLAHESGQYTRSITRVVIGKTDRRTGNIIEIQKRLHAQMLFGIAPSENDPIAFDDNGEEISQEALMLAMRRPQGESPVIVNKDDTISKDQHEELQLELQGLPEVAADMLSYYGIEVLADLPREEYHKARNRILKIKKNHEEYINRRS